MSLANLHIQPVLRQKTVKRKLDWMARRFFRHLEKDGHIPRRFSRTEWEDLAYW